MKNRNIPFGKIVLFAPLLAMPFLSGCGTLSGSDPDPTTTTYTRIVLGQTTDTAISANQGGSAASSTSLSSPNGVYASTSQLFVADTSNNRILIWSTLPTASGTAASLVLGQASLTTSTSGTTATTLSAPTSVFVTGTKLIAADKTNNRVLIWNTIPTANQTAASLAVGQASLTTATAATTAAGLTTPVQVYSDGTKLFVVDQGNHRVLIYNTIPTSSGASASVVVGQASLTTGSSATTQTGLNTPNDVYSDGTKLYIADGGNNRVLIYNTVPTSSGASASVVLGQSSFAVGSANAGATAPTSSSMSNPSGVWTYGTKLYVADTGNNRILIWNTIPTTNNQAADSQVGQANFVTATANGGSVSSSTLNGPKDLRTDGTTFWIADTTNNRVVSVTPSY